MAVWNMRAVARLPVSMKACTTVKSTPLLAAPPTVTTTFPVVAPAGTVVTIDVEPQPVNAVAGVPLNVTVLVPWVAPKFVPVMVMVVPTAPLLGEIPAILGVTVKLAPLLETPLTVTTTRPLVAPSGTGTTIEMVLQLVGVAAVPLNVTVLVPWLDPKLVPLIVTDEPIAAALADKVAMVGVCRTVNGPPLLLVPFTVTTTFPDVAPPGTGTEMLVSLQFVGVPAIPLNVTVLVPCVVPKLAPVIVTDVPTVPDVDDKLVIVGGCTTVKATPLLATPPTVTTTFPEVAPAGTGTLMLVALQLVGVPAVPLKVTVLVPCLAPKFVPVIVTEAPGAAAFDDKPVMVGVEACPVGLSETLSKVAVASEDVFSLDTTSPTNTFCAMVIV
jgi:hypothetical protein